MIFRVRINFLLSFLTLQKRLLEVSTSRLNEVMRFFYSNSTMFSFFFFPGFIGKVLCQNRDKKASFDKFEIGSRKFCEKNVECA